MEDGNIANFGAIFCSHCWLKKRKGKKIIVNDILKCRYILAMMMEEIFDFNRETIPKSVYIYLLIERDDVFLKNITLARERSCRN